MSNGHRPGADYGLTNSEWYALRSNAMRMKNWGFGYGQIAEQLQIEPALAEKLVVEVIKEITDESAEMFAARQVVIGNDLIRAFYPGAMNGDKDAAMVIQRVNEHNAKLFGLYAPSRVRVGMDDGEFAVDAVRLMRELGYQKEEPQVIEAAVDDGWADT